MMADSRFTVEDVEELETHLNGHTLVQIVSETGWRCLGCNVEDGNWFPTFGAGVTHQAESALASGVVTLAADVRAEAEQRTAKALADEAVLVLRRYAHFVGASLIPAQEDGMRSALLWTADPASPFYRSEADQVHATLATVAALTSDPRPKVTVKSHEQLMELIDDVASEEGFGLTEGILDRLATTLLNGDCSLSLETEALAQGWDEGRRAEMSRTRAEPFNPYRSEADRG